MTLTEIAREIARQYNSLEYTISADGRAQFTVDGLTVRCHNSPDAVSDVVAKYKKGLQYGGKTQAWPPRPRSTARRFTKTLYQEWYEDGDLESAESYLALYPGETRAG